jgi:plastocyanin
MLRKVLVPTVVAGLLAVPAITPAFAATKKVNVGDNWFVRKSGVPRVTVSSGDKVTWVWTGNSLHNVTVTKGPAKFKSDSQTSGRYSKRVSRAGTYTIVCTVHGASDQSMKLVVR